jgi:hypothetical protein
VAIGTGRAAGAGADGYVVVASLFVTNPFVYDTVPYDPVKDFDPATLPVTNPIEMIRNMTIAASDFTLTLHDWERHLARAKWMIERDSFHHVTAYDDSEIRCARNGNVGVSVGVIFMRILGAGMLLPRR